MPDILADLCRRCSGFMVPGMGAVTISPGGPGEIIACHKCRDCGWSVTSWHGIGGKPDGGKD